LIVAFFHKILTYFKTIKQYLTIAWRYDMNREDNRKVSSKDSQRLLKNLQNTTGDYNSRLTL